MIQPAFPPEFPPAFPPEFPPQSVVELLQALVRIPSVNPMGTPGGENVVGEQRCAEYLMEFLKHSGAIATLEEVLPGRPNVVGVWPSDRPGKPRLVFGPHTDTVSVAGMTINPFGGELRDDRVWGRGSSDTKGPMSSMLWAIRQNRDILPQLSHEIVFAGFASEEAGQHGAKAFLARHGESLKVPGSIVLAGEPTGLSAVIAHRGALWLNLTTRGRSVHASQPQLGENAIYKMADIFRAIRDEIAPAIATKNHPLLGRNSISAGIINGGSKVNIVPDLCTAEVDVRFSPGNDDLLEKITGLLRRICPDVEIEHHISQPMHTDPNHPVITVLQEIGSELAGAPWFSDAAIFAQAGIPAIAIGPGSIAQAHVQDEFIKVTDLEGGVAFFSKLLQRLR